MDRKVLGNKSHLCSLVSGVENASPNPRAHSRKPATPCGSTAQTPGHTLPGRAFQSSHTEAKPVLHLSPQGQAYLASWCLSYVASGHTVMSHLLWAAKLDKTKVPNGGISQFAEC